MNLALSLKFDNFYVKSGTQPVLLFVAILEPGLTIDYKPAVFFNNKEPTVSSLLKAVYIKG